MRAPCRTRPHVRLCSRGCSAGLPRTHNAVPEQHDEELRTDAETLLTTEPSCKDEARIDQQGTLTRVWAERGSRPWAPRDQRYAWAYLFGAICPARGTGAALVLPFANADMMNLHLAEISAAVAAGAHAVLTIDGAGWHQTGDKLCVPDNITLLHLPPYSPELNPVENVWAYLRGNKLSNRVFDTYDAIVDACCDAWTWFMASPERVTSIAICHWAQVSR